MSRTVAESMKGQELLSYRRAQGRGGVNTDRGPHRHVERLGFNIRQRVEEPGTRGLRLWCQSTAW